MAKLKIFVSSTCYDLSATRAQLRRFIESFGYEAVLSDNGDVLYHPRMHTHASCVAEVENCQMLVVIIGGRFGGSAVEEARRMVHIDQLEELFDRGTWPDTEKVSITQLEVLSAVRHSIPIYALVDRHVYSDHHVYEKNKNKTIDIEYPSINVKQDAPYIFEFINYLRRRPTNNSIAEFTTTQDIEDHLRKQWSGYFQRLLIEQRNSQADQQVLTDIGQQIDDLRAAVVSAVLSAVTDNQKGVAKTLVEHRKVLEVAATLVRGSLLSLAEKGRPWADVIEESRIVTIKSIISSHTQRGAVDRMVLELADGTFWRAKFSIQGWQEFAQMWEDFLKVDVPTRKATVESILHDFTENRRVLRKDNARLADVFSANQLELVPDPT